MCNDPVHDELMKRVILEVKNIISPLDKQVSVASAQQDGKMNEILGILKTHELTFASSGEEVQAVKETAETALTLSKNNAYKLSNYKWFIRAVSGAVIVLIVGTIAEFIRR